VDNKGKAVHMADDDWKKRVGIKINFSPESSDDEG